MASYMARPMSIAPIPAVVVAQEIFGVNSHIQSVTSRFASYGYVALAPTFYHRQGPMIVALNEEREETPAHSQLCKDSGLLADVQAAVEFLKTLPYVRKDQIGIVGFCFGGRVAYLSATKMKSFRAVVDYYGGGCLHDREDAPDTISGTTFINAPLLGIFGEEDQSPSPEDVKTIEAELTRCNKIYEFHPYPGAGHGFFNAERDVHNADAAKDAWLDRYLK
jgi:carboxymethylenebutenolidase